MKILVIGDPIIDKYTTGNINRMSPEDETVPVLDVVSEKVVLGGCLNVAVNLKSLNPQNDIFVAAPMSGWTIDELISSDVSNAVEQVFSNFWEPAPGELVKHRLIHKKTGKQIVRVDSNLKFDKLVIGAFKRTFSCVSIDNFDCIVISDYEKGCVDWFVVEKLKGLGCPIFIDTKKKDLSMWKDLGNAVVKINWNEFQNAQHTNQIKDLVVTHGPNPVQLRRYDQLIHQFMVHPAKNPNPIGAGDIFLASLVTEYLRSNHFENAIEFAVKITEKSVEGKIE